MINFLVLMTLPMLIALTTLFVFRKKIHMGEFAAQLAVPAVFIFFGLLVSYYQSTADVEMLNGRVVGKAKVKVSCGHSYPCRCRTVTRRVGKTTTTSVVCDTCYEHSHDFDWRITANYGPTLGIARVDRQGVEEPPRWSQVFVGEPFSSMQSYTNYILANPDSVLLGGKGDTERFKALLPETYPSTYDYYRSNHFVPLGFGANDIQDSSSWQWLLRELNADLGPTKQVNILLLVVKSGDSSYIDALKDHWVGGKKNDVLVVVGSEDGHKINFADIVSWTPNQLFKVKLRDRLLDIGTLDRRDDVVSAIRTSVQEDFVRMNMKDFEYLVRSFQPSSGAMIFLFILASATSIGLAIWAVNNDIHCDLEPDLSKSRKRYSI